MAKPLLITTFTDYARRVQCHTPVTAPAGLTVSLCATQDDACDHHVVDVESTMYHHPDFASAGDSDDDGSCSDEDSDATAETQLQEGPSEEDGSSEEYACSSSEAGSLNAASARTMSAPLPRRQPMRVAAATMQSMHAVPSSRRSTTALPAVLKMVRSSCWAG